MAVQLQILFLALAILLAGCKKEEPNPENLDPIYADLVKGEADDQGALAAEEKKLSAAQQAVTDAEPLTVDLKNAQRDVARSERIIWHLRQMVIYDHIRTERRRVEDKISYHQAFAAGKDWPERDEYQNYLVNRRLASAPRSWDAHLPKLFEKKPVHKAEKAAPKKEE